MKSKNRKIGNWTFTIWSKIQNLSTWLVYCQHIKAPTTRIQFLMKSNKIFIKDPLDLTVDQFDKGVKNLKS